MKILVVEDSTSMRAYLTTLIEAGTESYDLEVVEAASGFEALKTLPHH
jgi:CheY-like chemotaxis protein